MGWTHSLNHGLFLSISPLIPLMATDGYDYSTIGLLLSVYLFLYSMGALVSAPLLRITEDRKALFLTIGLQGGSAFLLLLPGVMGVALYLAFSGIFASLYHPVANVFIFGRFKGNVNTAMGLHGTGGNLAQFVFPILSSLLAASLGWKTTLIAISLLGVCSSPFYMLASRQGSYGENRGQSVGNYLKVVKYRPLWLLIAFSVVFNLYYRGIEIFLPTFLSLERGVSAEMSSFALSIALIGGALGQYVGGIVGDRCGEVTMVLMASLLGVSSVIALQLAHGFWIIAPVVALLGLAFYSHQPAANALLGKTISDELRPYVYSVWFFVTFFAASPSTLFVGIMGEHLGFANAIMVCSFVALVPVLVAMYLHRRRPPR